MSDVITYPHRMRILIPAYACAVAWALLGFWVTVFALGSLGRALGLWHLPSKLVEVALSAFVIAAFLYVATAFMARCTQCNRHIFIEGFRAKHPSFKPGRAFLGYFGTTVVNVLRRKPFQCMYCGTAFMVPKDESEHAT